MNDIDKRIIYIKLNGYLQNGQDANSYCLLGPNIPVNQLPKKDRQGRWLGPNSMYIVLPDRTLHTLDIHHNWQTG